MSYQIGDFVRVWEIDAQHGDQVGRINQVLPRRLAESDFQEYVVEFQSLPYDRFRFSLCREFELRKS